MWYINQPEILRREFFIIKLVMRKSICPILYSMMGGIIQVWFRISLVTFIDFKTPTKGNGKRGFCMKGYKLEKFNLIVTPLQLQGP
jgi:hypothetical protein